MADSDEPKPTRREPGGRMARSARRATKPARKAFDALRDGVTSAAEPLVGRVSQAIDDVERTWHERPGARVRRVRRMGALPLDYLYERHPEARLARPVQVGTREIEVADICGTAVGGGDQRGGDFLPLKPFRGHNWTARWQRLRAAQDRLAVLPPIDVVKYDGCFWVLDGHNRVALAKYGGQIVIDATVVELVAPGDQRSEPVLSLAADAAASRSLRTAGSGQRPSDELARDERFGLEPLDDEPVDDQP